VNAATRPFRISLLGLAGRVIGNLWWQALPPERRPVASVVLESDGPGTATSHPGQTGILFTWVLVLLAVTWAAVTGAHFRSAGREFLRNPPGSSLGATANHLRGTGSGPWRILHPPAAARVRELARRVEDGRAAFLGVQEERKAAAGALSGLGPAGRLVRGPALTAAARRDLRRISASWHRETLAYVELSRSLEPYETPPATLRMEGMVTALPPGRALQITPLSSSGVPLQRPSPALRPGDRFDFTAPLNGMVLLTDLEQKGATEVLHVCGDLRMPLVDWSDSPLALPGSGQAEVRFGNVTEALSPRLKPLSREAQAELAAD
jgi:hypothetical protein